MANVFSWALSHVADFQEIFGIVAADVGDIPKTFGHGELIAFLLKHKDDIPRIETLVAKIMADYPSPGPGPLKLSSHEDFVAGVKAEAESVGFGNGAFLQWLIANGPAVFAFIQQIISLFKPKPVTP